MIFYFLWGDPLFSQPSYSSDWRQCSEVDDELLGMHRGIILLRLELLYIEIAALRRKLAARETYGPRLARAVWTIQELLKHVDPETAERIMIERQVNTMDPDFSFSKAIGAK